MGAPKTARLLNNAIDTPYITLYKGLHTQRLEGTKMGKTLVVNVEGNTESDLEFALEQVIEKVREGYTSGMDSNDTGRYDFEVKGDDTES